MLVDISKDEAKDLITALEYKIDSQKQSVLREDYIKLKTRLSLAIDCMEMKTKVEDLEAELQSVNRL